MMMTSLVRATSARLASFSLIAALASGAALAGSPSADGTLPIYPGANLGAQGGSLSATSLKSALQAGIPLGLYSNDDEAVVDAWYRSRLHGASRVTNARGAVYDGPQGFVKVERTAGLPQAKFSKTAIVLGPK